MGQEWASAHPFLFFCDFGEDLSDAVRDGRRKEFASFPEFRDPAALSRIPDPNDENTFDRSKLDWGEIENPPHDDVLRFHKQLLALRRSEIVPRLGGMCGRAGSLLGQSGSVLLIEWRMGDGSALFLLANVASEPAQSLVVPDAARLIYATDVSTDRARETLLAPWTVAWFVDDSGKGKR